MRRKTGMICLILGVVCLVSAMALLCYNTMESRHAMESSRDILTRMQSVQEQQPEATADPYENHVDTYDQAAREMTLKEIDGYEYIGYLSIPVLEQELPVMSEWDYDRLKIAPCRQYGSTKTDDLVIAAHNYASHFGRLSQLRTGDLLTFTDMDAAVVVYEVIAVDVLDPAAVDVVKNSDFDLVLYTCTYGGESRIAVFCNRMEL